MFFPTALPVAPAPRNAIKGLEDLFRKHSDMVYRVCLRYTKNRQDAEDMVSEVFLKVERKMDQYRGDSKPMVWIYRIAVNQCLDYLRAKRTRRESAMDGVESGALGTQEAHGERALAKITLERILEKINPVTRKILFLHHVEGLTHGEIARVLKATPEGISKRLRRFSEQMKKRETEGIEPPCIRPRVFSAVRLNVPGSRVPIAPELAAVR